jgi:hypothetical protein
MPDTLLVAEDAAVTRQIQSLPLVDLTVLGENKNQVSTNNCEEYFQEKQTLYPN